MEQVRDRVLDNLCEAIGDDRDAMNTARTSEKGSIQAALKRMVDKDVQVYRHARVELSRVPGAEKLRVRMTKEEGDAGESDLETGETGDLEDATDREVAEAAGAEL